MNTHHSIFAALALASIALSSSNTAAQVCGTPPTNVLIRSSVCGGPVRISWTNPTGVGTVNPIVWRSPTRNFSDASLIYITGSGGPTTYADTPPTSGVNYYYWVGGNVFGCGTAPPAQSQSLPMVGPVAAGAFSLGNFPPPVPYPVCNGLILDWQPIHDATSIRIFRIADNFSVGETIATLAGSATTYTDTAAVGGNRYIYGLLFTGACGSSTFSTSLTTVRPGPWAAPTGVSRSIVVGQTTTLTVDNAFDPSASPMVPFPTSITWSRNGVPITDNARISGSRTEFLTIRNARTDDAGTYQVTLVSSCDGASTVVPVVLSVTETCRADYDQNGSVAVIDILDFLNAWFAGCP